jgi:hypothetical protein
MKRNIQTALAAIAIIMLGLFLIRPSNWEVILHRRSVPPGQSEWKDVTSHEASFQVAMPGNPVPRKLSQSTPVGTIVATGFELERSELPALFFIFSYRVDIPAEAVDSFLDGTCKEVARIAHGRDLCCQPIALGEYPGREMTFEFTERDQVHTRRDRLYLAAHRYYHLSVSTPQQDTGAPHVTRFLDSFRLFDQ